jgi:Flp pilus assembly protein TadD
MGMTLYQRGHPRLAEALWARAVAMGEAPEALERDRAVAMAERAATLRWRGRPGDEAAAEDLCARAIAGVPDVAPALLRLGATLTNQSRESLALPLLQRSLALEPGRAGAHLALVHTLLRLDRHDEAREAIERAALLLPEDGAIAAKRVVLAEG